MISRIVSCGLALVGIVGTLSVGTAADDPGQRLYEDKCGLCHGAEGRGAKAPRLVPFEWSYEQMLRQLRYPECDMPPIPESELSDEGVAQIVAYLKTIDRR